MGKSYPVKIGTKLGVAAGRDYRPDGRVGPGHLTGLAKPEVRRSFHAPCAARHPVQNRVDLYRAGSRPEHNLLSAILDLEWTRRGPGFRIGLWDRSIRSDNVRSAARRLRLCWIRRISAVVHSSARNARGLIHSDPATPTDGCAASSVHQNRPNSTNPSPPSDDADRSIRDQPFSRYPGYRFG